MRPGSARCRALQITQIDWILYPIYKVVLAKIVFKLRHGDLFVIFFEMLSSLWTGMRGMSKACITITFQTRYAGLLLQFKCHTAQLTRL